MRRNAPWAMCALLALTGCGQEVGAISDPQPVTLSEVPELECSGQRSRSSGSRMRLPASAPPVSPRQAMARRLRHNGAGLTVDDLIRVVTPDGHRAYVLEVEGKLVASFGLGRDRDVWYVGGEEICYPEGNDALRSRLELDCDRGDSVEDEAAKEEHGSAEQALDAYLETRSTWLRREHVIEVERERQGSTSNHDVDVTYLYERDGKTAGRFIVWGEDRGGTDLAWYVQEAAACGHDIIDRPGTVGDDLECGGEGFGGFYDLRGFYGASGSATADEAMNDSLRRRGSALRAEDLVTRSARDFEGVSYEYLRGGRTVAIFDTATPGGGTWFVTLDEWCAEVEDEFFHDDAHLPQDRSTWPGA